MFENKKTKVGGIPYSRYIASWVNVLGTSKRLTFCDEFREWLASQGCDRDEVDDIYEMATCGKLELETSVTRFMRNKKD